MNYYPFHIGDYAASAGHLTALEDGAYRRLLDLYYTTEQALPADVALVQALVRAKKPQELEAVATVLSEFFVLTDAGWRNNRCEREIAKYRAAAEKTKAYWKAISAPVKTAMQARRRAAQLRATPPWLTAADNAAIQSVYAEAARLAKETGIPHDVDHVVPLQGESVCGLHVAWNLDPIPAARNRSKGRSHVG